ncbi:hypothetical protein VN97_g4060 [Penicillium thymicola]|uniref:Uncharacterized protein n=1 Tax=Penicillium thymicola TaxID=293382 RepID=A0AAI9X9Q3_PENTH|nr:hypothetical protein VN97_g4060 [Penicillium thymicola]
MKFSILALSALLAFAAAADTTTVNPSTITSTPEIDSTLGEVTDICCTAKCYHVPCPSDNQVNDTNNCVSACPQGTGSPADIQKYTECEQSCYNSHFWGGNGNGSGATATHSSTTSTGTGSTATRTSSDSSSTDSKSSGNNDNNDNNGNDDKNDNDGKNGNDDSSSSGTATSSSGFSQQTANAAANVNLGASAAGLFGLVAAAFAL